MSIGQAEEYRSYWQPEWKENPPNWPDKPDADRQGDYWDKYWDSEWQRIIFGVLRINFGFEPSRLPDEYDYTIE